MSGPSQVLGLVGDFRQREAGNTKGLKCRGELEAHLSRVAKDQTSVRRASRRKSEACLTQHLAKNYFLVRRSDNHYLLNDVEVSLDFNLSITRVAAAGTVTILFCWTMLGSNLITSGLPEQSSVDSNDSLAPATHQEGELGWACAGLAPASLLAGGLGWASVRESKEPAEERTGEVEVVGKPRWPSIAAQPARKAEEESGKNNPASLSLRMSRLVMSSEVTCERASSLVQS